MNGVQLTRLTCGRPTSTTSRTIATLRITMALFTRADSLIPTTSTAEHSPAKAQLTPTRIIDRGTAGPEYSAATCPVITKMPAPMTAPMPSVTRLMGPRARVRACSPLASASARRTAMGLVVKRDIQQSGENRFTHTAMWDGRDSSRDERDLGPAPLPLYLVLDLKGPFERPMIRSADRSWSHRPFY